MSVGPQLPAHLQKQREEQQLDEDSDTTDSENDIGPRLPEVGCRGPAPRVQQQQQQDDESSDDDDYGPSLPPHLANRGGESGFEGRGKKAEESDTDDDDIIGPKPPTVGDSSFYLHSQASDIERRAQSMKDKIEGKGQHEVKRESWMLELPDAKAKSFGLGPRTFSRKGKTELGDRSVWTETPEDKARRARGEQVEGGNEDEEERKRQEYLINKSRDDAMSEITEKLKKKRGSESLLERHEKELKKKSKKDKKDSKERRPFDRDADLGANKFDEAQRKLMIKKAAQIDSRFSSGQQKFL